MWLGSWKKNYVFPTGRLSLSKRGNAQWPQAVNSKILNCCNKRRWVNFAVRPLCGKSDVLLIAGACLHVYILLLWRFGKFTKEPSLRFDNSIIRGLLVSAIFLELWKTGTTYRCLYVSLTVKTWYTEFIRFSLKVIHTVFIRTLRV